MVESFHGGDAISQLWLYTVAPRIGGKLHQSGITTVDTGG